jgi:hypothetical protein
MLDYLIASSDPGHACPHPDQPKLIPDQVKPMASPDHSHTILWTSQPTASTILKTRQFLNFENVEISKTLETLKF